MFGFSKWASLAQYSDGNNAVVTSEAVFSEYDFILGPTTTTVAYNLDENMDDPRKTFMDDVLVIPVNMAGNLGIYGLIVYLLITYRLLCSNLLKTFKNISFFIKNIRAELYSFIFRLILYDH